ITGGGLNLADSGPLGASLSLPAGKNLIVAGAINLGAGSEIDMGGGGLTAPSFTGTGHVAIDGAQLTLSASGITVDPSSIYGASIYLPVGSFVNVSGAQLNNGTVNMSGGSLGGAAALTNNSVITGNGVLTG